ncbi:adenylyl-sulfate kinase [Geomonas limicola]|uniref:Adenylyl-sulfate kinase n=1 Tax=Geomonas limicola TaxID=2740186 RepID=A0A6V8NBU1_9BACT|nr:adenylyl-sulfate kinase [Geomonas limicola]GFO69013.1 adenylyl-sulfate kinase [Geomonas limicola]
METRSSNVTWHERQLTREDYQRRNGHGSLVLWFTGLSGSGKSTLAHLVEEQLFQQGWYTYLLDGDNVRHGLNGDLGFSEADRRENIRRVGEVSRLFVDAGVVVLTALISPYREDRDRVRALFGNDDFIEIFLDCPLEICEQRDPKGLYRKARAGELPQFTGIDSPYEAPLAPEITINTGLHGVEECVARIISHLRQHSACWRKRSLALPGVAA